LQSIQLGAIFAKCYGLKMGNAKEKGEKERDEGGGDLTTSPVAS